MAPTPSDPTPLMLRQRLLDAERLLVAMEKAGAEAATGSDRMMLRGVLHELESLKGDVKTYVDHNWQAGTSSRPASLVPVNEDGQIKIVEYDDQRAKQGYLLYVEKSFQKVRKSLKRVIRSKGHKYKKSVHEALELLRRYRSPGTSLGSEGKSSPARVAPITEPIPTFQQDPIEMDPGDPSQKAPPPAYTYSPRAPLNMYAAAGDFLYAAAPITPVEASSCNFNGADLGENVDVQLVQEIRDLAGELKYSPARIFAYVSNNIEFEPYFGSLKGALATLKSGSGNATDQASLTIALLRASNIPARYVKGRIRFVNDQRLPDWVGAKTQQAAINILAAGKIPAWTNGTTSTLSHVWVEACVPYGNYRGTAGDNTGHHWIPLDPSFKNKKYQDGIAINVDFDYATYMSTRRFELPNEYYEQQVTDYIRTQPPRFDNNTLDDVGFVGKILPQKFDILPSSLPYEIQNYEAWTTGSASETPTVPPEHRYTLHIEVGPGGGDITTSLAMPSVALDRVSLGFRLGSLYTQQSTTQAWNDYTNFLRAKWGVFGLNAFINNGGFYACFQKYVPALLVDGSQVASGPEPAATDHFCTYWQSAEVGGSTEWGFLEWALLQKYRLKLTVYIGEGTSQQKQVNTVSFNNINSKEHHSIQAYAFQASDRVLAGKATVLLQELRNPSGSPPSDPTDFATILKNTDSWTGAYLDLVGQKYMRYISDAAKKIGELNDVSGWSGNHIGITSSGLGSGFRSDLPFTLQQRGLLIDVPGGQFRGVDVTTGDSDWDSFLLAGYTGSAFESYIWQENARMDAVSSVRGIQFARDQGIEVLTLTQANLSSQVGKLTTNSDTNLNYSTETVNTITSLVNGGSTVIMPRSLIEYENWIGQVYIATNQSANGKMQATFAIGPNAGGYTVSTTPVSYFSDPFLGLGTGFDTIPTFYQNSFRAPPIISSAINFGSNQYSTIGGDPVNMVTGNMYHTETDISVKGRGLPIVFERTYNSMEATDRDAVDVPLGYGWTHSFNHYLEFNDDDFDTSDEASDNDGLTSSVTWVDGSGARKFISVNGGSGGVSVGAGFTPPEGFFFQVNRISGGRYTLKEKNGTTYTFASVAGTVGQKARLESVADPNGNTLTLTYSGARLDRVTDGLGRFLQFGYGVGSDDRIDSIQDWDGRRYEYQYDTNGDLVAFRNPLAIAGSQPPVTYSYYGQSSGQLPDALTHAMRSYNLPRGNGMTFEYYMNGKVFRHSNTNGETITFTYNDFRREATTINERGYEQKYFFDEKGNPTRTVEQGGGERGYTYDAANPMNRLSETDPMGYETRYAYDSSGNVTTITHPSGATTVNSNFNSFNQPGKVKDPNGNYTLYKYDAKGNRTQVIRLKSGIGAGINPASYSPNPADILAWTITSYDSYGNPTVIKQVRDFATQVGPTVEFNYNDTVNNVVGLNAVTMTRCGDQDGNGIINRASECQSAPLSYDALGRLKDGIDENWYAIHNDYDDVDRIIRATDAVGNLRDFSFDANGNATGQKLVLNEGIPTLLDQSSSSYDLSDRVDTTVDAGGYVTSYQYDASGNVVKITNPDGYSLDFEYDANNQVTRAYDEEGHVAERELDISGRVRRLIDPNGNTVEYEYWGPTNEGRLKRQYDAVGRYTEFDYDNNGNVTKVTVSDPTGVQTRTTYTQYDALNRPVRIAGPVYTDAVLGQVRPVTTYQYDNLGNLTQTLAGHTTDLSGTNAASDNVALQEQSGFDDFGRRLTQTDPLIQTWRYAYDDNNNLTRITDPKSQIVERTYLYGGLLDVQTTSRFLGDPNPHIIDYDYDDLGQVIQVTSPEVIYSYQYNTAHRLVSVVDERGRKALEYRYSPGGMLDAVIDSEGNQTDYLYDPVGRLTGIWAANGDLAIFARDDGGRLTEKLFSNGTNTRYGYNPDDTVAQIVNRAGSGTLISQHDYTYDGFGNRDTHAELIRTVTKNFNYNYDPLDRLTAVRDADNANALIEGYSYDPLSRRRSVTAADGSVRAYVHDAANQLNSIRQGTTAGPLLASFGYDPNGNVISKTADGTTLGLTYDALDRLVQADINGVPSETYAYDPQGRRIEKNAGGVLTRYRYAGADIYTEYGNDWTQAAYLYTQGPGVDDPLTRADAFGLAQYYHQDGLGSIVSVTDMVGEVTGTARYDAWGNTTQATGSIPRYGYTGREPDATGLIYYRARYYDPTVGRFTQRDPKGFIDGVNRYAYAINNPVNFTDPRGASAFSSSRINSLTQATSYYSTSIPTGNAAAAYYSQISSSSQSLGRRSTGVGSSSLLDNFQTGLDVVGLVPGIGELADLVNAGISFARGDTVGASLSLAAAVPFVGAAATTGKLSRRAIDEIYGLKAGIQANRAAGKAAEGITEASLRQADNFGGRQVTFETSTGQRTVIDFVTKQRSVVETKLNSARLSPGQRQLFDDIQNGRQVIPRGQNAFNAGLRPGRPTTLTGCRVDRICQ